MSGFNEIEYDLIDSISKLTSLKDFW